jgi:hypothetical protein
LRMPALRVQKRLISCQRRSVRKFARFDADFCSLGRNLMVDILLSMCRAHHASPRVVTL